MRRVLRLALAVVVCSALVFALAELSLRGTAALGLAKPRRPDASAGGFWDGDHPVFGVWHRPNASFRHRSPCFSVGYRSNSVGARDVERPRRSTRPRTVVLGDSYLEGWGLPPAERLSNLLELATGIAHLNFAMAHFGPYQELLAYRELARGFDHEAVLIGLLPTNDFVDLDPRLAAQLAGYEYRYRPYLVADGAGFRPETLRESALRRWLRRHSWLFQSLRTAGERFRPRFEELLAGDRDGTAQTPSFFYDFDETQLARLRFVLDELVREAGGRRVAIVLIPVLRDLVRYEQSGPDPLSRRLAALEERDAVAVVNLLPSMHGHTRDWARYFHACDYHWNAFGNRVAAEILIRELSGRFYPGAPSRPAAAPTS